MHRLHFVLLSAERLLVLAGMCCLVSGCQPVSDDAMPVRRDFTSFRENVHPVLLRDCGFPACHGSPQRFFRVWGPGRARLPGETSTPEPFDLPTGDELSASYSLALSFIDGADLGNSDLLRKPLAIEAGGTSHDGIDAFGRNIYRTQADSGFVSLTAWVYSLAEQP